MGESIHTITRLVDIKPLDLDNCLDYALLVGHDYEQCRDRYIAALVTAKFTQQQRDKHLDTFDEIVMELWPTLRPVGAGHELNMPDV